jgi:hypothetical protein
MQSRAALGLLEFIRETKFHAKTLTLNVGICEYKTGDISPIFNLQHNFRVITLLLFCLGRATILKQVYVYDVRRQHTRRLRRDLSKTIIEKAYIKF